MMHFSKLRAISLMALLFMSMSVFAQWEQVLKFPTAKSVFVTKSGNILAANYQEDFSGGIMISEDQGATWTKTNAEDFNYSFFIEGDGEIYATGSGCVLSRSTDNGKTWEMIDYSEAAEPLAPKGYIEYCDCYAAVYHGNRLYIADFSCGVFYTEDHGQTWHGVNYKDISINDGYDSYIENLYALAVINDKLYAFGLYYVYRYNPQTDRWTKARDSNCLAVNTTFDGRLVCGRSIMNDSEDADFLLWTTNGYKWYAVDRPKGLVDNYVRALTSDDQNIYAGLLTNGVYYTSDFGSNWIEISEGLPKMNNRSYYFLISMANDKDYVYAALYFDNPKDTQSGIYRIAKSSLTPTGISATPSADGDIQVNSGRLVVTGEYAWAQIVDMTGKVPTTVGKGGVDLSTIPTGIYVCNVMTANGMRSTKFVNN